MARATIIFEDERTFVATLVSLDWKQERDVLTSPILGSGKISPWLGTSKGARLWDGDSTNSDGLRSS